MSKNKKKHDLSFLDQKATIQTIVFITIAIVIVLTSVSFIQIYSNKKNSVLKNMKTESVQLKSLIKDNLNYSSNFIYIISNHIRNNSNDLDNIAQLLKAYVSSKEFNFTFGWRKFSWIDENFHEVATSTVGRIKDSKTVEFLEEVINTNDPESHHIITYTKKKKKNNNSLKIIKNIFANSQFKGSIVLSYDIHTLVRNLNMKKKHASTNFIILNDDLEVIAQSNIYVQNLSDKKSDLSDDLKKALKHFKQNKKFENHHAYLDMLNGLNYHISQIADLPFILVVNTNSEVIKNDILQDIIQSFFIVCLFAFLSLLAIIFIYKRETSLRAKSERASLIATHAAKAKTNFLAFTAHEIRSPLGFILTGSELMSKQILGTLPETYQKYAHGINQNSKEILNFINDILDENQIIEGKFKITNKLHRIDRIIQEAIDTNLTRFNKRKVNISKHTSKELPLLLCDDQRLYQILNNLISNSIKYSNDNTSIAVEAILQDHELIISVRDEGHGMNEEEIPMALSPYCTIHGAEKFYSSSSYGLGLSIVKMLAEAHDAELRISSVKNKGTTIKIIFPKYKLVYDSHLSKKKSK